MRAGWYNRLTRGVGVRSATRFINRREAKMRLKTYLNGLLVICCLAGFAVHARAQSKEGGTGVNQWQRYELGNGTFSVLLPAKPKEEHKTAPPELGLSVDLYTYSAETQSGAFVVQYGLLGKAAEQWKESAAESFYNGLWDGVARSFDRQMEESKLPHRIAMLEKRKVRFNNYDGREVLFSLGPLRGRIMMTLIGRHAFGAMVVGTESLSAEEREKFFNSFTIKPSAVGQATTP